MTYTSMDQFKSDLLKERGVLLKYLIAKFEAEDFHGVQDAASDLRDIDSQLELIKNLYVEEVNGVGCIGVRK